MPVYYVKLKIYEQATGNTHVTAKAFPTLSKAVRRISELVDSYDEKMDEWENSADISGEYIVDFFGYGKKGEDNVGITLELTNMEEP